VRSRNAASHPTPRGADCNPSLPPSAEGEWWEFEDESRGGLPYYYQTKTGETVWERPEGFVIPLGVIQVCLTFPVEITSLFELTALFSPYHSHLLPQIHTLN
jgi:hypothetical protein